MDIFEALKTLNKIGKKTKKNFYVTDETNTLYKIEDLLEWHYAYGIEEEDDTVYVIHGEAIHELDKNCVMRKEPIYWIVQDEEEE